VTFVVPEGLTGARLAATFPAQGKTTGKVGIYPIWGCR
jgi:hypothetical protein